MTPRRALSLCLAALAFTLPLTIAGTNAALAALSLAILWFIVQDRRTALSALSATSRSPVFLALVAYAAWSLIASLAGLSPAESLRLWPKDLHKLWAFLIIGSALVAADVVAIKGPFALGFGLHAAVGVFQTAREWLGGAPHPRAHGFLHAVSYSEVLGLGMIGAAAYLARPGTTPRRRAAVILIAFLALALVASQTRAVLIALVAAYAAACILEVRLRRHALAAILILGGVVAIWEVMPTGGRNIRGLFSQGVATGPQRERLILWKVALSVARDRPITGVGPGQYRKIFTTYHPNTITSETSWGNAHNVYLHHLAERGAPGLLILLTALTALLFGAWRAELDRRDARSLCAATATVAFLVMNLTEVAWQTEQVATLFLFLWLLGAGPRPAREIL